MSVRPLLVALALGALALPAAPAAAAPPGFGTAPVAGQPGSGEPGVVRSVTYGRNDGFDRVVFTLSTPSMGYRVEYVTQLTADGSGNPVPVTGGAVLAVLLSPTNWTVSPSPVLNVSPGFPALRQLRSAGEFEANAQYGIGQATRAGFRVLRLTGPDRIVVDVAHPASRATPPPPRSSTSTARPGTPSPTAAAIPPTGPAGPSHPPASTAPSPAQTSAAAAAADPDTGEGSPVPAVLLGAGIALAAFGAAALGVHVARRPRAGG